MDNTGAKAPVVRLTPDLNKIVEAILFVLKIARDRGKIVTQYDVVKTLFIADRRHLNEYGRPITFDNYYAMRHGPVPRNAYNLLKGDRLTVQATGAEPPWTSEPIPGSNARKFQANTVPSEEVFSPSEIEIIEESFTVVKSLGFGQIRRITHEDAAYVDAWEGGETGNGSYPMSLALLFDEPNAALAEDLEFLTQLDAAN